MPTGCNLEAPALAILCVLRVPSFEPSAVFFPVLYGASDQMVENERTYVYDSWENLVAGVLKGNFQIAGNSVFVNFCGDQFERRPIMRDSEFHHFVKDPIPHLEA